MLLFFILLPNLFFIIGILHFTYSDAANKKSNHLYFLVTIPADKVNDEDLKKLILDYKKELKRQSLLFLLLGSLLLTTLLIPAFRNYIGITVTLVIIGYVYLPLLLYNRLVEKYRQKTLVLKREKNWQLPQQKGLVAADLKTSREKNQKAVGLFWFVIPLILSFVIYFAFPDANAGGGLTALLISSLVIQLLSLGISYSICHMPAKMYVSDSNTNLTLNQEYRRSWSMSYLLLSFSQNIFMFGMAYFILGFLEGDAVLNSFYWLLIYMMPALSVIIILFSYYKIRTKEISLLSDSQPLIVDDEDAYYEYHSFLGHFYNNPDNPATVITKPFGIGQTINLGTRKGRIYFAFSKYLILFILVGSFCLLGFEEVFTPVMVIRENEIQIGRTLYPMTIPFDHIEKIELVENYPLPHLMKNVGSATPRYSRGTFSGKGNPNVRLYLFHENDDMLIFHLIDEDNPRIYFNHADKENTLSLWEKLKNALPEITISTQAVSDTGKSEAKSEQLDGKSLRTKMIANETDYSIPAGNGQLHAVLNLPENSEKPPVVLIIGGSGPSTKEGLANVYLDLAGRLYLNDIASIRYDKRGIARSASVVDAKTEEEKMVIEDFVSDVIALLQKAKADERLGKIYLVGHSEGALVGTLVAKSEVVDGLITLAGAGRRIDEITMEQIRSNPNNPPAIVEESQKIFNSLKMGNPYPEVSQLLSGLFRPSVQPYLISWMKYHPAQEIEGLDIPILILQGDNDSQVQVIDAESLHKAAPGSKLVILPEMTHMLKDSPIRKEKMFESRSNLTEYSKVYQDDSLPFPSALIEEMTDFILKK